MTEQDFMALQKLATGYQAAIALPGLTQADKAELARHYTAMQNTIIALDFWRAERAKKGSIDEPGNRSGQS